jgi:hypothetical protein
VQRHGNLPRHRDLSRHCDVRRATDLLGRPDLHRYDHLWRGNLSRPDLRCGSILLGDRHLRRRVHLSRHADMRRPNMRWSSYMRRSSDVRAANNLQLRADVLEHLNLPRLDDLSGDSDMRAASHMCRYPDVRRLHDLSADPAMRHTAVRLSVPRRPGMRQRDQRHS